MIIKRVRYSKKESAEARKYLQYTKLPEICYDYDIILCYSDIGDIVGYAIIGLGNSFSNLTNTNMKKIPTSTSMYHHKYIKYTLLLLEIYDNHQRKGYGSFILKQIKDIYKINNTNRIVINSDLEYVQFYLKNKAIPIQGSYNDDEVLMVL
jgi:hypothetical protein